jgi:hypothetical protein
MQTERITILASPFEKQAMAARASARGVSMGEYLRRRALDDDDVTPEEEAELAVLVEQVNILVPKMQASIDRMNARLEEMTRKNEEFLRRMGIAL